MKTPQIQFPVAEVRDPLTTDKGTKGSEEEPQKKKPITAFYANLLLPVQTQWICQEEMQFFPSHQTISCLNCSTQLWHYLIKDLTL